MTAQDASAHTGPDRDYGPRTIVSPRTVHGQFRETVMAIANTLVTVSRPGERRRTSSLFEVLLHRLAGGQTSRRISPVPFIELVVACASGGDPAFSTTALPADLVQAISRVHERLDTAVASGTAASIDHAISDVLAVMQGPAGPGQG